MNCPHCKEEIESKHLPNNIHTVVYKIIFNKLGWCFPEHTEGWIYREILATTASAITKAFCDIVEGVYDGEFQFSYEEEELHDQENKFNKRIEALQYQIKKLNKRLKTKEDKKK